MTVNTQQKNTPGVKTLMRGGDFAVVLVVALAVAVSLSTLAGWLDVVVLDSRIGSLVLLVLSIAASVQILPPRSERPRSTHQGGTGALVLALPAVAVLAVAVVGAVRGAPRGIEWFLNGDHPRHVVFVADTWVQGNLSYAVEGYPRGWHSVLAALWSVAGAGLDGGHVARLLQLMAAASLLLSACLALALAHLGHALAERFGLRGRVPVAVGLVTGAASLLNVFLANYQALGYENSLLAALVVVVCCREVLVRAGTMTSLVVGTSGVILVSHAWQLLLPTVGLTALWCAVVAVRSADRLLRRAALVLGPVSLAFAAPGVLAVATGVGLDHAAEAGPDSPVPVVLLAAGIIAAFAVAARQRDAAIRCLAFVTVLPAATALAVSVVVGVELLHYYPSKLLWNTALLAPAWVALLAAAVTVAPFTRERAPGKRLVTWVSGAAAGLLSAFALVQPWGSQVGAWSTVDGVDVAAALAAPGASTATVVWLEGSPTTDSVTRILLDALRVDRTRNRAPQARLSVETECGLLRAGPAVVLSSATEAAVRSRYSCVPDLKILPARHT